MHTETRVPSNTPKPQLQLAFGFSFEDLYSQAGLERLHGEFLRFLDAKDAFLAQAYAAANPAEKLAPDLLIALAKPVQDFLVELFGSREAWGAAQAKHAEHLSLLDFKKRFVQRKALRGYSATDASGFDGQALLLALGLELNSDFEAQFIAKVKGWQAGNEEAKLDLAARYAAWAVQSEEGRYVHRAHVLFKQAQGVDPANLMRKVRQRKESTQTLHFIPKERLSPRSGFSLTDTGRGSAYATDQAKYCSWCHSNGKDSCSHGASEELPGCPLEERISEFQYLRAQGDTLAALAVICIDNPMLAATGHRICNDCVKACIFQSQDPVDIPQVETQTLLDVLALPWGVEMYSLLTRWNPLRIAHAFPSPASGKSVLIAGQGPAGFTLAHYLLNSGHIVHAIDGLRITPLGIAFEPVYSFDELREDLATREQAGFGGVAEYGITVRWDKNYLKLIRLLLERRAGYTLQGGVRLGSNLSLSQVWEMGFDHLALAMGAGTPGIPNIDHALAKGARAASDFLMSLQLTGAARLNSLVNILLRLPVLVIGGGLTAVDTATEALAYYPVQAELLLQKLEAVTGHPIRTSDELEAALTALKLLGSEKNIASELGSHGLTLRRLSDPTSRLAQLQAWGGVNIVYRKGLSKSPAYRLNHEELEKALSEGIAVLDGLTPSGLLRDDDGYVRGVALVNEASSTVELSAKCVLYATGTSSNTVLAHEYPETFQEQDGFLKTNDRRISFYGDMHPKYAGNVVKAMASAKHGAVRVNALLKSVSRAPRSGLAPSSLVSKVVAINRLTPSVVEVILHSPLAASNFEPGQFFRLQHAKPPTLSVEMEGLALTGAWVDKDKGLLSLITLEMGGSSNLVTGLSPSDSVCLMGPTGTPSELPKNKTVLLVGGGLGNAVLLSIGKALKTNGCQVLYFAGYKRASDLFKQSEIEAASTQTVWCCDEKQGFSSIAGFRPRSGDSFMAGNLIECLKMYATKEQGIRLDSVEYLLAIGSDGMMAAVAHATAPMGSLAPYLTKLEKRLASVNSPMQCMMKGVCGQCIQRLIDPSTGAQRIVFTCHVQDQSMAEVDWPGLHDRLSQNSVWEKVNRAWLAKDS